MLRTGDKDSDKDRHLFGLFRFADEWPKSRLVERRYLECLSAEAV
jgi:hypothetical protein